MDHGNCDIIYCLSLDEAATNVIALAIAPIHFWRSLHGGEKQGKSKNLIVQKSTLKFFNAAGQKPG